MYIIPWFEHELCLIGACMGISSSPMLALFAKGVVTSGDGASLEEVCVCGSLELLHHFLFTVLFLIMDASLCSFL